MKLHDDGWENSIYTSVNVYMIGNGCVVSYYPLFYYQRFEKYQVLTRSYLGTFEGGNWEDW